MPNSRDSSEDALETRKQLKDQAQNAERKNHSTLTKTSYNKAEKNLPQVKEFRKSPHKSMMGPFQRSKRQGMGSKHELEGYNAPYSTKRIA